MTDELTAASAVLVMSTSIDDFDEMDTDAADDTLQPAAVLAPLDGNTGVPLRPYSPSNIPPSVRGSRSLHDLLMRCPVFGSGRDRR